MKVLLGIPSGGAPAQPFLASLGQIALPHGVTAFDRYVVGGNFVPAQRELIVTRALDVGADVLVMCDDDMVLPPHALQALVDVLLADSRCAIAGALYYSRDGFRPMAVSRWRADDTTAASIPAFTNDPVQVDGIGFGCVAIRMDAVRELEPPYFPAHVYIERDAARVRVCDEDYLFCERMRRSGWHVTLHAGVRCGHFERSTGIVHPQQWEPAHTTGIERIAVAENGTPRLIARCEAPSRGEAHQRADLTYIWSTA